MSTPPPTPFAQRPWQDRGRLGAIAAVAGMGVPSLLLIALALLGGRYQTSRGSELDVGLLSVCYPLGAGLTGTIAGIAAPLARTRWRTGVLGFVAGLPWAVLITANFDPHRAGIWPVRLGVAAFTALLLGPAVALSGGGDEDAREERRQRRHRRRARAKGRRRRAA